MRAAPIAVAVACTLATVGAAIAPRADAQDDPVELTLRAQDFAIAPGDVLHLDYDLAGTLPALAPAPTTLPAATTTTTATTSTTAVTSASTSTPVAPAEPGLTVLVTALDPIRLRSEVQEALDGRFRPAIDSAEFDLVDVVGDDGSGSAAGGRRLILDVPTATRGEVRGELALPRAGLYPVRVEIRDGRRSLGGHVTFVERLATPDSGVVPRSTLNLSIVAGIPDPGPEPDTLDLIESNARITELADLGELVAAPLTVAVPPVVATALQTGDPALAARLQAALRGDEALAAPQALLDPSSAVAADQVATFTRELREGEDVLRRALPSTATRRAVWLTTEPLSVGGASMLRDLGVQLVVVPFDLYLGLESNHSPSVRADLTDPTLLLAGELADGGELALAVVDPVNQLLEPDRADDSTPTEIAVNLFAELMAMRIQLGPASRSFVLATPDLGIPDADVLAVIEDFVAEHPDVGFQTLSFVPGTTGPFVVNDERVLVRFPETAGVDLSARVHEIDLVRLHMEHAATMLPADDPRPGEWRSELGALMSTGIDDAAVTERLGRIESAVSAIEQAVQLPAPFTFTLAGDESTITLRFGNTSPTELRIGLSVSGPSRLTFPTPESEWVLAPDVLTDVTIPIRARSNGTSDVSVVVHTPSGEPIGEPIVLTARVAVSGLGQLLTGAALLVLATWWFSHFRRTRRRRMERDSEPSRNGHPSNGGGRASPALDEPGRDEPGRVQSADVQSADIDAALDGQIGVAATGTTGTTSTAAPSGATAATAELAPTNGELSPDAAAAATALEQPDG